MTSPELLSLDNDGATERIALGVSGDRNRELLSSLFSDYDVVEITDAVPDGVDLCLVDEVEFSRLQSALADWKRDQFTLVAPVLLLSESTDTDPWERYSAHLDEMIDAIQPIPAPGSALRSRVESLLEMRRYASELASERQLVEQIFSTSPIAKTVLDTDGNIVRANQHAQELFGLSESELSDRTYDSLSWEIIDADGDPIPGEELPFSRVMQTGDPVYGYEHGIERADGERIWLSINMGPIRNGTGDIEYLVATLEDVTERNRLERQLRESERLHRATLSNITDTVVITDDEGRFTYVCPNVNYIFGYTAEEVHSMGTLDALLGEDVTPEEFAEGDVVENIEHEVTDATGETHTVLITIKSVSIQGGTRLYSVRDVTEIVDSERALEQEQQRLETVLSNAPLALLVIDTDGTINMAKGKQLERLGFETSGIVGASLTDIFGTETRIREIRDRVLTGTACSTEIHVTDRVFQLWGQPMYRDGTVDHAIIVAQDVTERVIAEKERLRAEESRSLALSAAGAGVWEWDVNTDEVLWHESCERLYGLAPGTFEGTYEAFLERVHSDDRSDVENAIEKAVTQQTKFQMTFRIVRADGDVRWLESRATILRDESGESDRMLGVVVDITERKEREQELEEYERIIETATDPIFSLDGKGNIRLSNDGFADATGRSKADLIGTNIFTLLDADDIQASLSYIDAIIQDETVTEPLEVSVVGPRGTRQYEITLSFVDDPDTDGQAGIVGVAHDVTDLRDRVQQLQVLDRVLRHNLRNTMTVIRGHAEVIQTETTDPVNAYAERIVTASDELIDLAKKEHDITTVLGSDPKLIAVDPVSEIRRIADSLSTAYPDVHLELDLPAHASALATANLGQAIEELVWNAITHSDRDVPEIELSVTKTDELVQITIADSGPGVPEMDRRVVEGSHEIEPLYHSKGLGLWLVSWIVRRCGGTLSFEEREPRGTVVTISLQRTGDDERMSDPE